MDFRKIYEEIAEKHGVTVEEVEREIKAALAGTKLEGISADAAVVFLAGLVKGERD